MNLTQVLDAVAKGPLVPGEAVRIVYGRGESGQQIWIIGLPVNEAGEDYVPTLLAKGSVFQDPKMIDPYVDQLLRTGGEFTTCWTITQRRVVYRWRKSDTCLLPTEQQAEAA